MLCGCSAMHPGPGTSLPWTNIPHPPPTCSHFPLAPAGDPGRFVSREWLQAWADGGVEAGDPPPLDNAPLLCPHGKLDPAKLAGAGGAAAAANSSSSSSSRPGECWLTLRRLLALSPLPTPPPATRSRASHQHPCLGAAARQLPRRPGAGPLRCLSRLPVSLSGQHCGARAH